MDKNIQKINLNTLIEKTSNHLQSLNYSKNTLSIMNRYWKKLKQFAKTEEVKYFSLEFGQYFLEKKYQIGLFDNNLCRSKNQIRRAITILADFQQFGVIFKRKESKIHKWPNEYKDICQNILNDIAIKKLSKGTQRQYRSHLERFIFYLVNSNINSITKITIDIIDDYFKTYLGYKKSTIAYACYVLRAFFRYAFEKNYTKNNLVELIPKITVNKRINLPSSFTKIEIKNILKAVDRANPKGKRDYAILLLAIHYGMRVSEITNLKLDNLNFVKRKITYFQNKTGQKMSFDMLENVGWALIDYLKSARPKTNCSNVFIRMIPPYDAFGDFNNLSQIIHKYLKLAGIKKTKGKSYGMHTLRHTFACHLLEQGTPLYVISEVLGHVELNSTMIYTKVDLQMLKLITLEVPNDTK